jgi:hypothetical protein
MPSEEEMDLLRTGKPSNSQFNLVHSNNPQNITQILFATPIYFEASVIFHGYSMGMT